MSEIPKFAVVGHPNKGKSSLVATLARDEHVQVGPTPGTTKVAQSYPLTVQGKVLYELIDTPGFQRPREVLEWLRAHDRGTASRPHVLKAFIELDDNRRRFPDECELLAPIVAGAAIVFVVDGSLPFSEEYEVELEILRWSNSPRMGLVNPIANEAYVQDWRTALGQFCHFVRVFNPITADFEKCVELLEVCAQLSERWRPQLLEAVKVLRQDRDAALNGSVLEIVDLLSTVLSLEKEVKLDPRRDRAAQGDELAARFKEEIRAKEHRARVQIEHLYNYKKLSRREEPLDMLDGVDLFSDEAWRVFGLSKMQLTKLSAFAGAAAGGAFDIATGGSSLALGAAAGGLFGAGAAWIFGERLVEQSLSYVSVGSRILRVGPIQQTQFAFVLFNRARLHHALIARRAHADRGEFSLQEITERRLEPLSNSETRELDRLFRAIRKKKADEKVRLRLKEKVKAICARDSKQRPD